MSDDLITGNGTTNNGLGFTDLENYDSDTGHDSCDSTIEGFPVSIDSEHGLAEVVDSFLSLEPPQKQELNQVQELMVFDLGMFSPHRISSPIPTDQDMVDQVLNNGSYDVHFDINSPYQIAGVDGDITYIQFTDGVVSDIDGSFTSGLYGKRAMLSWERSLIVFAMASVMDPLGQNPLPNVGSIVLTNKDSQDVFLDQIILAESLVIKNVTVPGGIKLNTTGPNPLNVNVVEFVIESAQVEEILLDDIKNGGAQIPLVSDSAVQDMLIRLERKPDGLYHLVKASLTVQTGDLNIQSDVLSDSTELTINIWEVEDGVLEVSAQTKSTALKMADVDVCFEAVGEIDVNASGLALNDVDIHALILNESEVQSYQVSASSEVGHLDVLESLLSVENVDCDSVSAQGVHTADEKNHSVELLNCTGSGHVNVAGQFIELNLGHSNLKLSVDQIQVKDSKHDQIYLANISQTGIDGMQMMSELGAVDFSGTLAGTVELVDVSQTSVPDLRPVAGSLNLVHDGKIHFKQLAQRVEQDVHLKITDEIDSDGLVKIIIENSDKEQQTRIYVGPSQLWTSSVEVLVKDIKTESTEHGVVYYNPSSDVLAAEYAVESRGPLGVFVKTEGSVAIDRSDRSSQSLDVDLAETTVSISGQGWLKAKDGYVSGQFNGLNEPARFSVQPAKSVYIHIENEDLPIVVTGSLNLVGEVGVVADLKTGSLDTQTSSDTMLRGRLFINQKDPETGELVVKGFVDVLSPYQVTGKLDGSYVADFEFKSLFTNVDAVINEDMTINGMLIPVGTSMNLPLTEISSNIAVDLKASRVTSVWSFADGGEMKLEIPPEAVQEFLSEQKESIDVTLALNVNGQEYHANFDPRTGGEFYGEPKKGLSQLDPVDADLTIAGGENLFIDLDSDSSLQGLSAHYDIKTGDIDLVLSGVDFDLNIVDSLINMDGSLIEMDHVASQAILDQLKLEYDPATNSVVVTLTPPKMNDVLAPQSLEEWVSWSESDWESYRAALSDTTWHHLSVTSGIDDFVTFFPAGVTKGKGQFYIDFKGEFKTEISIDELNDPETLALAMSKLSEDVQSELVYHWEYPNPPQSTDSYESLIYSQVFKRFYVVNPEDAELTALMEQALGMDGKESLAAFNKGYFDLDDVLNAPFIQDHFEPEVMESLIKGYFHTEGTQESFTNRAHRFLYTLIDIKNNYGDIHDVHQTTWSDDVRVMHARSYPLTSFRNGLPEEEGDQFSYMSYIPDVSADDVVAVLRDGKKWKKWQSRMHCTRLTKEGTIKGRFMGDRFEIKIDIDESSNVPIVSFKTVDSEFNKMDAFSGQYRVLESKDGGVYLMSDQMIDPDGLDEDFYKAKAERYPSAAGEKSTMLESIIGFLASVVDPKKSPEEVHPTVENRSHSNLNLLATSDGKKVSGLRSRRAKNLVTTPSITELTVPSRDVFEYVAAAEVTGEDGEVTMAKDYLQLSIDNTNQARFKELLVNHIGLESETVDSILETGRLDFELFLTVPIPNAPSSEIKTLADLMGAKDIATMARFIMMETDTYNTEVLLLKSERFLLVVGDFVNRYQYMALEPRILDVRALPVRFHASDEYNKEQYSDSVDALAYLVYPKGSDYPKMLDAFAKPEEFYFYSSDYSEKTTRILEQFDDYKIIESVIPLIGKYRVVVPNEIFVDDNVAMAPWKVDRDYPQSQDGFYENTGMWLTVKLKTGEVFTVRNSLLNGKVAGDVSFAKTALIRVGSFLTGIFDVTSGNKVNVQFGEILEESNP